MPPGRTDKDAREKDARTAAALPAQLGATVADWIGHWARVQPEALAWQDDHRRCDYQTADRRITALAKHLDERGLRRGDRIALWLGNRGASLETLFAAARLGAVVLPINSRLSAEEVAFQLDDSTPRLVLIERAWRDRFADATARMQHEHPACLEVGTLGTLGTQGGADSDPASNPSDPSDPSDADEASEHGAPERDAYEEALAFSGERAKTAPNPRVEVGPEDPLILMYTSGTTGKPKGALLPNRKALYNSLNAERFFEILPSDRVLVVAPLFHSLGLQILAIPAIHAGAGLVIQEGFDAVRVWSAIDSQGITYFGGVPTMHQRLLEALKRGQPIASPPTSLRFAFTAGAAAPVELIRAFDRHGLLMKQGYGQTETSILTCLDSDRALAKAGSVGHPVEHAEIRLIDPTTIAKPVADWRDVAPGEVGEVVVAGPITMLGYWQRPEATAETLRSGWLRTGDLATRDDEFDLTLVGRAREMYISGGENVYPAEVEATLVEHPDIAEAAVVAVPDPEWGEVGRAHVVAVAGRELDSRDLSKWLGTRLARYKQPKTIQLEESLPRTASGKVQKHLLREAEREG